MKQILQSQQKEFGLNPGIPFLKIRTLLVVSALYLGLTACSDHSKVVDPEEREDIASWYNKDPQVSSEENASSDGTSNSSSEKLSAEQTSSSSEESSSDSTPISEEAPSSSAKASSTQTPSSSSVATSVVTASSSVTELPSSIAVSSSTPVVVSSVTPSSSSTPVVSSSATASSSSIWVNTETCTLGSSSGTSNTLTCPSGTYKTTQINTQVWMAENLKYIPEVHAPSNNSVSAARYYVNGFSNTGLVEAKQQVNFTTYGVLYNYAAARTACPSGWHLPTDAEWKTVELALGLYTTLQDSIGDRGVSVGNAFKANSTLWAPNNSGTDSKGFTALPGGAMKAKAFIATGGLATFWTKQPDASASLPFFRELSSIKNTIYRGESYFDNAFSVRCVQN